MDYFRTCFINYKDIWLSMKRIILGMVVLSVLFVLGCSAPPEDLAKADVGAEAMEDGDREGTGMAVNPEMSSFEFEGYGPGKSHVGTFDVWSGDIVYSDGQVVSFEGVIDATSVNTGIEKLDGHLKSADFFDVETYPKIIFTANSVSDRTATGTLDFHGVKKDISFPVEMIDGGIKSEFLLNMNDFGIEYTGVNPEARISFELKN